MLFNSFQFLCFFIVVFIIFVTARRISRRAGAVALILSSIAFYSYWEAKYTLLLIASILLDYGAGRLIEKYKSKTLLGIVICINLLVLGYFKYSAFLLYNISSLTGANLSIPDIVLPLGISFYIFQQISYQVDLYRGKVGNHSLVNYASLVCFFPHLIAGPIVLQKDVLQQFASERFTYGLKNTALGLSIFSIGLFKKVILADNLAPFSTPAFNAVDAGVTISFVEAWCAATAYTFQLYFDFSGYSDMAIGLSRVFGIRLPINFFSPYKSVSIIDFWRRWHMTLSAFLREYLYIPLGGSHMGTLITLRNLVVVMLLGGFWHGAGWNFIIWGALHGVYLASNHSWIIIASKFQSLKNFRDSKIWYFLSWFLTFISIVYAWVFFRAETLHGAISMIKSMNFISPNILLPNTYEMFFGQISAVVTNLGVQFVHFDQIPYFFGISSILMLGISFMIVLILPNTSEIFSDRPRDLKIAELTKYNGPKWCLNLPWAIFCSLLLFLSIGMMGKPSEFLYFQF